MAVSTHKSRNNSRTGPPSTPRRTISKKRKETGVDGGELGELHGAGNAEESENEKERVGEDGGSPPVINSQFPYYG